MNYKIFDDFLSKEEHEQIKDMMLSANFPWYYNNNVAYPRKDFLNEFYFIHLFVIDGNQNSDFYPLIESLTNKIKDKINFENKLVRIKANMYPNINQSIENPNHIDYNAYNIGVIYSVNTNNGATILVDDDTGDEIIVDSIANRLLFFDGYQFHRSRYCTDEQVRVNINFNFLY